MWQVNCSLKCEEKLCSKAFRVVLPFLQSPGWHVIMLSWCSTVMGRFGIPRCSPPTSFGVRRGIMGAETWPEKPETLAFSRDQCYSCYIWYASCDLCSVFIPDPLRGSIEPVASVFFLQSPLKRKRSRHGLSSCTLMYLVCSSWGKPLVWLLQDDGEQECRSQETHRGLETQVDLGEVLAKSCQVMSCMISLPPIWSTPLHWSRDSDWFF